MDDVDIIHFPQVLTREQHAARISEFQEELKTLTSLRIQRNAYRMPLCMFRNVNGPNVKLPRKLEFPNLQ